MWKSFSHGLVVVEVLWKGSEMVITKIKCRVLIYHKLRLTAELRISSELHYYDIASIPIKKWR